MSPDATVLPDLRRSLASVVVCATAAAVLWWLPGPWPPVDLRDLTRWWDATGTPDATIALVRSVGLALAGGATVVAVVAALAASGRAAHLARVWVRWAPTSLRRALAVSTVAVSVTATTPPAAADTDDPPLVVDLGATHDDTGTDTLPRLVDLGPTATAPSPIADAAAPLPSPTVATPVVDPDDRWVVALGDHLWSIAEETLRDRGADPSDGEIARYWRRLIDANRQAIGTDPDVVHPGLELRLPR